MAYNFPQGPRPRPLVGNTLDFRRDRLGFLSALPQRYGNAATLYLGRKPAFFFARPQAIRYFLVDNAANFTNREVIRSLRYLLGDVLVPIDGFSPRKLIKTCCGCTNKDGMLATDGEAHHQQRQVAQSAFNPQQLEKYSHVMVEYTERMMSAWRTGSRVDISQEMLRLTLQIVAKTLFDLQLGQHTDQLLECFKYLIRFSTNPLFPWDRLPLNIRFLPFGKYLRSWQPVDQLIRETIAIHRTSGEDTGSLLYRLSHVKKRDGGMMSYEEIRAQFFLMLDAGHNTTSNALTWTLYLLSEHPHVHTKLVSELRSVLDGQAPQIEDLGKLKYLEMVIKESLRLYPPIWGQARFASNDFEIDGYKLPAGSFVVFSQWVTHRLPDIFSNPNSFWPERFDAVSGEPHVPYSYFPFGGGYHSCIGSTYSMLEAKLVLATILQRFHPVLVPGSVVVPKTRSITLQPAFGMPMILKPLVATVSTYSSPDLFGNGKPKREVAVL